MHPCNFIEGESVEVCLDFIEDEIPEDTFWSENKNRIKDIIPSQKNRWEYFCYGQLQSIHPVTIDCGIISFTQGDWLNDVNAIGSYVYFVIARLDINKCVN
jgi:hypothetical protein